MTKIRVLEIIFQSEIKKSQIPLLRSAIIQKAGHESILFHNHVGNGYRFRYPHIQYKRINRRAALLCLNEGIAEIHRLFRNPDLTINLGGQVLTLDAAKIDTSQYTMQVWDKFFHYRIETWLALNQKNEQLYNSLDAVKDKIALLERLLTANILSFAKGIDWHIEKDKKIQVIITGILAEGTTKFKGIPRKFFNLEFKTNVFLPAHIGLGKAASRGFGVVYPIRKRKQNQQL